MLDFLFTWTRETFGALGVWGLFLLAVIESIFFPIPVDVLIILLAAASPELWWFFGLVAAVGSVAGAMIGYWIGMKGQEYVLRKICPEKYIVRVHELFNKYESLAIFIAGFTPIPYKVFAVGAGVFYIRFWPFVLVSFIARSLRFLLVAFFAAWYANNATALLNAITIFGVLLFTEIWLGYKIWKKK